MSSEPLPTEQAGGELPPVLADLVTDFASLSAADRLQFLHDLAWDLPALPDRLAADYGRLEHVAECQSPIFLLVELDDDAGRSVHVHVDAPAQAATSRGFAEVVRSGLEGVPAATALTVPDDLPLRLGLSGVVSPLRLNGMVGLLGRVKRQVAAAVAS